jgi:hypothetical protein
MNTFFPTRTQSIQKPKSKLDLDIVKLFMTFPQMFRHHADIALFTRAERRATFRALDKLVNAEILRKHRMTYYFNIDLVGSLYGKKTGIKKKLQNNRPTEEYHVDRDVPLDLVLIKHFLSDQHGWWKIQELSLLFGRPSSTIQYNIDELLGKNLIIKGGADNLLSKNQPLNYKLAPNFAMSLTSDKSMITKTIQETIQQ